MVHSKPWKQIYCSFYTKILTYKFGTSTHKKETKKVKMMLNKINDTGQRHRNPKQKASPEQIGITGMVRSVKGWNHRPQPTQNTVISS